MASCSRLFKPMTEIKSNLLNAGAMNEALNVENAVIK